MSQERSRSGLGDVFTGVSYLFRGLGWIARHPRQWLFGLIPAVIVLILYVAGLATLGLQVDELADWLTPFADDWADGVRRIMRIVAGLAIFGAGAFLAILTFTALTLLVGDPFYESIAVKVEDSQGGAPPEPGIAIMVQIWRAVLDAVILGSLALVFAVTFFVLGFLPVVGQTVVPVVAACVSGYFLAGGLTGFALGRRGLRRKQRAVLLRRNRLLAVGFGAATFVIFLIPLGAVLAMPGAVAGATLLARERLADKPLVTAGNGEVAR